MIQTMKLVKYKYLSVNLKTKKIKKKENKIKELEDKIKKIKELGTPYYLEFKDFTHKFRPQEVNMTNKVLREKSNCVICRSNKSRFLNQKHNNKK